MQFIDFLARALGSSRIELVAVAAGLLCVWLLVKENIWNWPIGIANNILYIYIFLHAGLYADMGLQFVYIAIAFYGWWNWLHGGQDHSELNTTHVSSAGLAAYSGMVAGCTAVLYLILRHTPSTVPFSDALTTALFLTAQYMMSRKLVENWWFWIVGNVIAIALYIYKDLRPTAILYSIFVVLCVMGLREWRRAARQEPASVPAVSAA
jgi:nicotinamide mononucleotide transporter